MDDPSVALGFFINLGERRRRTDRPSYEGIARLSRFAARTIMEDMKVLLASPRGFCAGVNMAIESLDLALDVVRPPIYVYHEIVHNSTSSSGSAAAASSFVDDSGRSARRRAPCSTRAHGVSPEIREHRPRAEPAGDRRHLPAGDQGPPGGGQVRPARATRSC